MNKRVEMINKVQALLRETDHNDVTIKYGYRNNEGKFVESVVDVNGDQDKREMVLIKYDSQPDEFGTMQSIEMNGLFWIVKDVINAVDRL